MSKVQTLKLDGKQKAMGTTSHDKGVVTGLSKVVSVGQMWPSETYYL